MITHVETVAVCVTDQDRAVRFFVDQLGSDLRKDRPMGSAEKAPRWIEAAPPDFQRSGRQPVWPEPI